MNIKSFILALIVAAYLALPVPIFAQAYGGGAFNSDVYNGSAATPTPTTTITSTTPTPTTGTEITPSNTPTPIAVIETPAGNLPITGATILATTSIGALLVAAGLLHWTRNHRKSHA